MHVQDAKSTPSKDKEIPADSAGGKKTPAALKTKEPSKADVSWYFMNSYILALVRIMMNL